MGCTVAVSGAVAAVALCLVAVILGECMRDVALVYASTLGASVAQFAYVQVGEMCCHLPAGGSGRPIGVLVEPVKRCADVRIGAESFLRIVIRIGRWRDRDCPWHELRESFFDGLRCLVQGSVEDFLHRGLRSQAWLLVP